MNNIDTLFTKFSQLNWKLFLVGFAAGFVGILLTHGGVHVPQKLNPFSNQTTKAVMVGK